MIWLKKAAAILPGSFFTGLRSLYNKTSCFLLLQGFYEGRHKNSSLAGDSAGLLVDPVYRLLVHYLPHALPDSQLDVFPHKDGCTAPGCVCICGGIDREPAGIIIHPGCKFAAAWENLSGQVYRPGEYFGAWMHNLGAGFEILY